MTIIIIIIIIVIIWILDGRGREVGREGGGGIKPSYHPHKSKTCSNPPHFPRTRIGVESTDDLYGDVCPYATVQLVKEDPGFSTLYHQVRILNFSFWIITIVYTTLKPELHKIFITSGGFKKLDLQDLFQLQNCLSLTLKVYSRKTNYFLSVLASTLFKICTIISIK